MNFFTIEIADGMYGVAYYIDIQHSQENALSSRGDCGGCDLV